MAYPTPGALIRERIL
jgi:ubiquitin